MIAFLVYDLKVALLVAVFYMFYRLLLSRETFHRVNRMVLLTTAVASFVLPLCVVTLHRTMVVDAAYGAYAAFGNQSAAIASDQQPLLWQQAAVVAFFVGMVITLGRQITGLVRVWQVIARSEQHPQPDGTIICLADDDVSPFSWMRYIVLSRSDYSPTGHAPRPAFSVDTLILAHERGHISQHHTLDVLLVDTLTALQWFNPAMWMLRQDLRAIHEYEADAAVLSQGINMRQYQYLLIRKAVSRCGYSVANGITHSTLKNRINMMLHKKSSRASLLKVLALLPIVGAVLALQAETVTDYVYNEPQKKVVKKGRKQGTIKLQGQTVMVETDTAAITGQNVNVELSPGETLFVLDGEKVSPNVVEVLDPKTIDHIDVLKGPSAVEVYGEEARHGAVVITTKMKAEVVVLEHARVDSTGVAFGEAHVDDASDYPKVFDVVEQMPEFPGGPEAMMSFLVENVRYPEEAHKAGIEGRVIVSFIVEADGVISNAKVVKKVNDDLDGEAIRLVGSMPRWKPGMQNGQAVRVKYTMPVTFRLK